MNISEIFSFLYGGIMFDMNLKYSYQMIYLVIFAVEQKNKKLTELSTAL